MASSSPTTKAVQQGQLQHEAVSVAAAQFVVTDGGVTIIPMTGQQQADGSWVYSTNDPAALSTAQLDSLIAAHVADPTWGMSAEQKRLQAQVATLNTWAGSATTASTQLSTSATSLTSSATSLTTLGNTAGTLTATQVKQIATVAASVATQASSVASTLATTETRLATLLGRVADLLVASQLGS